MAVSCGTVLYKVVLNLTKGLIVDEILKCDHLI